VDVDISETVDISALEDGLNMFYIRAENDSGWSLTFSRPFIKAGKSALTLPADIAEIEYFYDNDPGYGNGIDVPISPGAIVDQHSTFDISELNKGLHMLYIRSKDAAGYWSTTFSKPFIFSGDNIYPDITELEYFIDEDPGFGNAVKIAITENTAIDVLYTIDIDTLSEGLHTLYMRSRDANGRWSTTFSKPFIFSGDNIYPDITKLEYFIDEDPGFGNAANIAITENTDIDVLYTIAIDTLSEGLHTLYKRGMDANGRWSTTFSKPFIFSGNNIYPDITELEYFIDEDPGFGNAVKIAITGILIKKIFYPCYFRVYFIS